MPIAQLGFEGRYPVFTWATKPAANAVPVGTTITITEFSRSDWYSDGTHWRPKGGQATLLVQNLTMFSSTSTTTEPLAGYTSPVIPWSQLMAVPGFEIDTVLEVLRNAPATTQPFVVFAAYAAAPAYLNYFSSSSAHTVIVAAGTVAYAGAGAVRRAVSGTYKNASAAAAAEVPTPADGPVDIRVATGGAGETIFPKILQVVYRA